MSKNSIGTTLYDSIFHEEWDKTCFETWVFFFLAVAIMMVPQRRPGATTRFETQTILRWTYSWYWSRILSLSCFIG